MGTTPSFLCGSAGSVPTPVEGVTIEAGLIIPDDLIVTGPSAKAGTGLESIVEVGLPTPGDSTVGA